MGHFHIYITIQRNIRTWGSLGQVYSFCPELRRIHAYIARQMKKLSAIKAIIVAKRVPNTTRAFILTFLNLSTLFPDER